MGEIILNTRDNTLDVSEVPILARGPRSEAKADARQCGSGCWCRPCRPSSISSMTNAGTPARPTGASGSTAACPSHTGAVWSRTSSRRRPVGTVATRFLEITVCPLGGHWEYHCDAWQDRDSADGGSGSARPYAEIQSIVRQCPDRNAAPPTMRRHEPRYERVDGRLREITFHHGSSFLMK